ncbi:hypothetical protein [Pararoseomonas baculiformis]|nr:hypothetical protein [Pararoseomonas baculiformis]
MAARNAHRIDSDARENLHGCEVFLLTLRMRVQIAWRAHEPFRAIRV